MDQMGTSGICLLSQGAFTSYTIWATWTADGPASPSWPTICEVTYNMQSVYIIYPYVAYVYIYIFMYTYIYTYICNVMRCDMM